MTAELEATYRRALRWYPKRWRAANEDAVLGILLEQADDENRATPAPGELRDLHRSAIRTRLGFFERLVAPSARGYATVFALAIGSAISAAGLFFGGLEWTNVAGSYRQVFTLSTLGHNLLAGQVSYVIWLAALVALLARQGRIARILLVASVPTSIAWSLVAEGLSFYGHPSSIAIGFLGLLALVAAAGIAEVKARLRRAVPVSAGVGVVLLVGAYLLRGYGGGYWGNGATNIDYFWEPLAVWLIFAGIPVALVLSIVFTLLQRRAIAVGILFAGSPLIYLGLFSIGDRNDVMQTGGIVIAVFVAITIALGILRLLGLRVTVSRLE